MPITLPEWQPAFLERHRLPESYLAHAQNWFAPLVTSLAAHQNAAGRPIIVAANGSQGSGKTTLCDYLKVSLAENYGLCAVALSLDDFYLTRQQRLGLSETVHPLLKTRGVPGTHDIPLMRTTLNSLLQCDDGGVLSIPRFDKSCDDRYPQQDWDVVTGPIQVVLLEGWCLGAQPQSDEELRDPVNALERAEDGDLAWRQFVNLSLQDFTSLYRLVDQWVMLKAPSFDCVYRWRLEQEQRLRQSLTRDADQIMNAAEISRFIQFFQRITQQCLSLLPDKMHHLYILDEFRQVTGYCQPLGPGA